ncbi:hypothetical protein [Rhizobium sp.]|uniref:hypothetical protein n=1 Tax=Rhizobium sp. TaxID=391 RepID=UPI0028AA9BC5
MDVAFASGWPRSEATPEAVGLVSAETQADVAATIENMATRRAAKEEARRKGACCGM